MPLYLQHFSRSIVDLSLHERLLKLTDQSSQRRASPRFQALSRQDVALSGQFVERLITLMSSGEPRYQFQKSMVMFDRIRSAVSYIHNWSSYLVTGCARMRWRASTSVPRRLSTHASEARARGSRAPARRLASS